MQPVWGTDVLPAGCSKSNRWWTCKSYCWNSTVFDGKFNFFLLLLLLLLLCAKKVTTSRLKICIGGGDNSRRAAGPWRTCRRCGSWSRACRFGAPSRRSRRQTPMAPESTLGWTYRRRWNPAGPSPSWGGGEEKKRKRQRIKSVKDEGKQRRWGGLGGIIVTGSYSQYAWHK